MSDPSRHDDIAARLAQVLAGVPHVTAAADLQVSVKTIQRWLGGVSAPDGPSLLALAQKYRVDPYWLLTGEGEPRRERPGANVLGRSVAGGAYLAEPLPAGMRVFSRAVHSPGDDDLVRVPRYEVKVSAGNGVRSYFSGDAPQDSIAFSRDYMRRHFGRAGAGFATVLVRGDSMEPSLRDGDEVVVDLESIQGLRRDGVYVVRLADELRVKRLRLRVDGSLEVWGDNPAYQPEQLSPAQAAELQVVGRVVWPRLR